VIDQARQGPRKAWPLVAALGRWGVLSNVRARARASAGTVASPARPGFVQAALLGTVLLLAAAAAAAADAAAPARPVSQWRVSHEIEGYGEASAFVCLVEKKGLFGRSWQAAREADAGPDCAELIAFDPASETIYLAFPGALATAEYICSKGLSIEGRHPCKSGFFSKEGSEKNRRRLDREALGEALDDAKAYALAAQVLAERREQRAREEALRREQADREAERSREARARAEAERRAACLARLDAAATPGAINVALEACGSLVEASVRSAAIARRDQLDGELRAAALREYRAAFAALGLDSALESIERFIRTYQEADPEQLVPRARALREESLRRRQLAQAELARQAQLRGLEARMEACQREIRRAQDMLSRELKVSADSGVPDPERRRRAAEIQYDCKTQIDTLHGQYLALGGARARDSFD
jgi:hypothetical protein